MLAASTRKLVKAFSPLARWSFTLDGRSATGKTASMRGSKAAGKRSPVGGSGTHRERLRARHDESHPEPSGGTLPRGGHTPGTPRPGRARAPAGDPTGSVEAGQRLRRL